MLTLYGINEWVIFLIELKRFLSAALISIGILVASFDNRMEGIDEKIRK